MLKMKLATGMLNKKVLIIDFDKESLLTLSELVEAQGFEVVTATDGQQGLEKFQSENPDLVIMEAMLPKLHGFDLCLRLNCDFPRKVPIIIVTGVYREALYKSEALRFYGAAAYFEKPWKREELRSTILNLLIRPEGEAEDRRLNKEQKEEDEAEKRERKAVIDRQVEKMLQDTLVDLGIDLSFKKKKPVKEPELDLEPPGHEEIREKKELATPRALKILFREYTEEKKKSTPFPVVSLIVFIVLVSGATIIFFNSKKSSLSPREIAASPPPSAQVELLQMQTAKETSPVEQKRTPGSEEKKGSLQKAAEGKESELENIEPEIPEVPLLKIQGEPAINPQTFQKKEQEKEASKEDLNPPQALQTNEQLQEEGPSQLDIKQGDVIPLELVDIPPVPVKTVQPKYPSLAYTMGIEGSIILNALISENGDVVKAVIIRGIKNSFGLEKASENAVLQWKFKPAQKEGIKVKVWKPVTITFKKK